MKRAAPAFRECCYSATHRWLERSGLGRGFDFRWCEVLRSDVAHLPPSGWDPDSLWMGEVGPGQLDWLAAFAPDRRDEFAPRWSQGRRCFAAALAWPPEPARCVGYVWATSGPCILPGQHGYRWQLPPNAAWIYDARVHPLVLGTYPDLARFAFTKLRAEGATTLFGQVEYDNRVSRRVHRMLGGHRVGAIATLSLLGARIHLDRYLGGRWHIRFGAAPIPLAAFGMPPARLATMVHRHVER